MAKIKVCLDAGHYGKYNRSPAVPAYYESDMNWKLHLLLKKYLEQYGIQVVTTRANKDVDLELYQRGAASKGCDLFLSIHSNATGGTTNESVDYVAAYHLTEDSGTDVDDKSKALAEKLAPVIASIMGVNQGYEIMTRKASSDKNKDGMLNDNYYGVLNGARQVYTPGMILEHSFHTNTRSTKWLMDDSNLDKLAKAEADVIAKHYGAEKPESKPVYRVISGAYTVRENADAKLVKVRKIYPEAIMIRAGEYFKIQIAEYDSLNPAKSKMAEVKANGLDCYISTDAEMTVVVGPSTVQAPAKPSKPKKSLDEIARAVINGDFGNGHATREANLKNAGLLEDYTYQQIRKRVNELYK